MSLRCKGMARQSNLSASLLCCYYSRGFGQGTGHKSRTSLIKFICLVSRHWGRGTITTIITPLYSSILIGSLSLSPQIHWTLGLLVFDPRRPTIQAKIITKKKKRSKEGPRFVAWAAPKTNMIGCKTMHYAAGRGDLYSVRHLYFICAHQTNIAVSGYGLYACVGRWSIIAWLPPASNYSFTLIQRERTVDGSCCSCSFFFYDTTVIKKGVLSLAR